jgi:hypothetical protein
VKITLAFVIAFVSLAWASAGLARDQRSFKAVLGKGYEIKSVTFARGESTENREVFIVTLQKEKSMAVCYFAALNWINLSDPQLEDTTRCDVRSFE